MDRQNSSYRWIVYGTALFAYFLIVSQRTAPGLVTDQLMKEFEINAAAIGLLTSIQFLIYSVLQIPIGILSDRYGPNLFLIIGTLLSGIGTLTFGIAQNEFALFSARFLMGLGDAAIWINLVIILSQWFKVKEFVGLIGLAGMAGSFGFLLASMPFSIWISLWGWRVPFFATGLILCIMSIILYMILIYIPKQGHFGEERRFSDEAEPERENVFVILSRIIADRQAWAAFLCHFGVIGTYVGFIGTWAIPFGMNMYEMSRSEASQLVMVGVLGAIIGAPLTSWISSRLLSVKRPYLVVHLCVFCSWLVFFLLGGKPPFSILLILFFLLGYGNGAGSLTFAIVRESFPSKEVGVVSGFANTGGFISAILLPGLFGKVLDHFQNSVNTGYHYGMMIPMCFALIGVIGVILIKEQSRKTAATSSDRNVLS